MGFVFICKGCKKPSKILAKGEYRRLQKNEVWICSKDVTKEQKDNEETIQVADGYIITISDY